MNVLFSEFTSLLSLPLFLSPSLFMAVLLKLLIDSEGAVITQLFSPLALDHC